MLKLIQVKGQHFLIFAKTTSLGKIFEVYRQQYLGQVKVHHSIAL